MDDRRRTISSEEQMIGEALMRVSNTLEAQRLTKSLDYQEKLRTRSNIRLVIAIICLFVAVIMMVISGALLFILWRYADPILDTVMPFLKGMFADFQVIWDGLVESLSYVPVMVEQLTRLLEQVIIMLEGINRMNLAGLMGYLTRMLGGLMNMMDDISKAFAPMLQAVSKMMTAFANGGFDGLIESMFGVQGAESFKAFMTGMLDMMAGSGKTFGAMGELMTVVASALSENAKSGNVQTLINAMDQAIGQVGEGISGNVTSTDMANFVQGAGKFMNGAGAFMEDTGEKLWALHDDDRSFIDILRALFNTGALDGLLGGGGT